MSRLLLIKNYDPLILLEKNFLVLTEKYQPGGIEYISNDLDILYEQSQVNAKHRASFPGDLLETKYGLYIILGIGFKKVDWGDTVTLSGLLY